MLILGLTGSIGMGKSATALMFAARGIPVYDADAAVHALYRGAAVAPVEAAFPGVSRDGSIDRDALGKRVLGDSAALKRLESIVHPLVGESRSTFLAVQRTKGARIVMLDIPLLFETNGDRTVDATVLVSAPEAVQRARVLARPGMTEARFEAIVAKQMPDSHKRARTHFLIDTSRGFPAAQRQVDGVLRAIAGMTGRA